ncbi:low temperature requirement protein A [Cellulomonas alba]|uniref:Low temperature requirement protein A n=1 Tax=Cellulomonas alba TaxID=3053467 RepID=A0ABT7SGB7_9CELL|nr:low temperature requirement protein A [Cellulomonas alba]MDM7855221.1 low temperature requirement protein A [Cellulomonas alba]
MTTARDAAARWLARVGLRTDLLRDDTRDDSARVGYVELFFDLVFVFAITQLSHTLIHHTDATHLLRVLVLAWAVWWLWIDSTWVTNWLDPERVPVRAMLVVMMALGLLMSSAIPEAFGEKALLFAIPYVTIQVGRTVFTTLAMGRVWTDNAVNFLRITTWLVASGVLWVAGALVDEQARTVLWVLAALMDLASPRALFWVPGLGASDVHTWAVRSGHMAERVSLFVIISLGESIVVTGGSFSELSVSAATVAAFLAAFTSTVLMWLLFFDRSERSATRFFSRQSETGMVAQTAYTYVPYVLVVGIVLTAVGDGLVLAGEDAHRGWTAAIVCGSAAVYLVGNALFRRTTGGGWSVPHLVGAAVAVALVALAGVATAVELSWAANVVMLAVLVADVAIARRRVAAEPPADVY